LDFLIEGAVAMSTRAKTTRLSWSLMISLGLVGLSISGGRADVTPTLAAVEPAVALADFVTHTESNAFRIQYPQAWQVDQLGEDTIEIVSTEPDPTMDIHTKVQLLRENPDAVVNRSIDAFVAEEVLVRRYSLVRVDNQSGFRIWMGNHRDQQSGMQGNAIATFIGYGEDQTAVLLSQYSPDNPEAEELILQMHDSFVNTGIATAERGE
jgi:hypothetical protein